MNTHVRKFSLTLAIALGVFCTGVTQPAQAQLAPLALPDEPLFLGISSVLPNVLFALDNSGSMSNNVILTDAGFAAHAGSYTRYGTVSNIPRAILPDQDLMLCYVVNGLAYNPNIVYKPWSVTVSSAYGDKSLTAAVVDFPGGLGGGVTLTDDISDHVYPIWNDMNGDGVYQSGECPRETRPSASSWSARRALFATNPNFIKVNTLPLAEQTNYANWYSYYRTPIRQLKSVMFELIEDADYRAGIIALNAGAGLASQNPNVAITDLNDPANKQAAIEAVDDLANSGATRLRDFLNRIGDYFAVGGHPRPFGGQAFTASSPILSAAEGGECQKNFAVLLTDGAYTDTPSAVNSSHLRNADSDGNTVYDAGPHAEPNGTFNLSDIAMYYYETDLAPALANKVEPSDYFDPSNGITYTNDNPAQHLTLYGIGLGVQGRGVTLPPDHKTTTAAPTSPRWQDADPRQTSGGTPPAQYSSGGEVVSARVEDLRHATFNARGLYFTPDSAPALSNAFRAAIAQIKTRSGLSAAGIGINNSGEPLSTNTRIFQAKFNPGGWSGELTASSLTPRGELDQEVWEASALLPPVTSPNDRKIYAGLWTPSLTTFAGVRFTNNPTIPTGLTFSTPAGSTVAVTTGTGPGNPDDIIEYISGVQSKEGNTVGDYRQRTSLLGDIVSSSLIAVGYTDLGHANLPGAEGGAYPTFLAAKRARFTVNGIPRTVVYAGANDGMLHAFHDTPITADAGKELFAYIPAVLFDSGATGESGNIVNLLRQDYNHEFYVNGNQSVGDVCTVDTAGQPCTWKSILVGSLGEGGRGIYALDVTDPFNFDENDVLWEYDSTHFNADRSNFQSMGYIKHAPEIARLHNGQWGVIFGNGHNHANPSGAVLFILDVATGNEIAVIRTNVAGTPFDIAANGLSAPRTVDEDGDRIADTVYAGDLNGHLYKFDISDSDPTQWDLAHGGATPLFSATDSNGDSQPITTRPSIIVNPQGGFNIVFGTGKYLETPDASQAPPHQVQTLYSIWDDDLDTSSSVVARSDLVKQEILEEVTITVSGENKTTRIVSDNTVSYGGTSPQKGWYLDTLSPSLTLATADGERSIADSTIRGDRAIFPLFKPSSSGCDANDGGGLLEIDALSGARLDESVFDINGDGVIDNSDYVTDSHGNLVPVSGVFIPGTLTAPTVVALDTPGQEVKLSLGLGGKTTSVLESATSGASGRQSWQQLR